MDPDVNILGLTDQRNNNNTVHSEISFFIEKNLTISLEKVNDYCVETFISSIKK